MYNEKEMTIQSLHQYHFCHHYHKKSEPLTTCIKITHHDNTNRTTSIVNTINGNSSMHHTLQPTEQNQPQCQSCFNDPWSVVFIHCCSIIINAIHQQNSPSDSIVNTDNQNSCTHQTSINRLYMAHPQFLKSTIQWFSRWFSQSQRWSWGDSA